MTSSPETLLLNSLITSPARIDEHRQPAGHFPVFVTSADSGIYVLNNITSRDKRLERATVAGGYVGRADVCRCRFADALGRTRQLQSMT